MSSDGKRFLVAQRVGQSRNEIVCVENPGGGPAPPRAVAAGAPRRGILQMTWRYDAMPAPAKRVLTVKLPPALERRLERAAERRGAPKSELVRAAIERYVRDDEPSPRSFGRAAADLAGVVDGAADLSTGARHLRGYGK